jgi:hypothetical protein
MRTIELVLCGGGAIGGWHTSQDVLDKLWVEQLLASFIDLAVTKFTEAICRSAQEPCTCVCTCSPLVTRNMTMKQYPHSSCMSMHAQILIVENLTSYCFVPCWKCYSAFIALQSCEGSSVTWASQNGGCSHRFLKQHAEQSMQ